MKISKLLLIMGLVIISSFIHAQNQNKTVKITGKDLTFKQVFEQIEKQTGYSIDYDENIIDINKTLPTGSVEGKTSEVLKEILKGTGCTFEISESHIILQKNSTKTGAKKISGIIHDSKGEALIGATVIVKGLKKGTVTDVNGKFTLDVPSNSILNISYIGYLSQQIRFENQNSLNITLEEDSRSLDEVIVVGYGTTTKSNLTTSVSQVKTSDIPSAGSSSVNQLLFGRATGLQVSTQSAEPGGNVNLSVRGRGNPLIVMDGVVIPNDDLQPTPGITELNGVKRGGLGNINPADIESIEVLKDASAAIYGVAASNGVILITTKKGKSGRMNISYDGSHSIVKNMPYLQPLNASEYMTYYNIFSKDCYGATTPKYSSTDIANAGVGTDWMSQVLRSGSVDNHSVNINGGTDKVTYYFSGNYFNQVGTMQNSDMNRFSGKMNVSFILNKFIKFNANISAARNHYTNSTAGWQNGGSGSMGFGALQAAIAYPTILPLKDANGKNTQYLTIGNPVALLSINDKTNASSMLSNFSVDIDIIPQMLSAKLLYGNNLDNATRNFYIPSDVMFDLVYKSRGAISTQQRQNQTMEATLAFKKSFEGLFNLDAIAGCGQYVYDDNGFGMTATDMLDATATDNMGAAPTRNSMSSYKNFEKKRSYFARANFDILDRYLVSLVYRADGIDKFFPENKYASFPSASVGWKISNESFMKKLTFVELLKVRASIGVTGLPIGTAAYGRYSADGNQAFFDNAATIYTPYYLTAFDQPNLRWQKTINNNIGLDFGLFKNRISGSIDLFQDKITDLLTSRSTNQLSMVASAYDNGGSQIRSGVEFALKTVNIATKNFDWDMVVNVSNYLWRWDTRYSNQDLQLFQGVKDPVNSIYVFPTNGILKTGETPSAWQPAGAKMAGAPKFVDTNNDGVIDYKDVVAYNRDPKYIFGFGNNFRYKEFDLGIFLYAQFGAKDFNNTLQWTNPKDIGAGNSNATTDIKNVWSTVNENGNLPGGKYTESVLGLPTSADTYLASKDFIRCRNISLGYTIKSGFLAKYARSVRVYADIQNPFIFTKYIGGDPEVQANATKGGPAPYPMARTYSFGLNVNF